MKKYQVVYRDEFLVEVEAMTAEEAIAVANKKKSWQSLGALWECYFQIVDLGTNKVVKQKGF